ncbi:hypothetical protein PSACC_00328 [Paramicrosporidium saccamoebae]|uniref:Uncharacterized protein n=1 Tax=Paramicrosporidium saccamoebae TaxID=1246581 RepID=A0A2H9TQ37_9FUNG|nr:hypothetical protein PSACC_00328 [Paramicrosporidium saccamoebae]
MAYQHDFSQKRKGLSQRFAYVKKPSSSGSEMPRLYITISPLRSGSITMYLVNIVLNAHQSHGFSKAECLYDLRPTITSKNTSQVHKTGTLRDSHRVSALQVQFVSTLKTVTRECGQMDLDSDVFGASHLEVTRALPDDKAHYL